MRTYNVDLVSKAVAQYGEVEDFYAEEWLDNKDNIALINDNKDVALFQRTEEGLSSVYGHYFFWSRGKEALKAAKNFLEEIFTGDYNVNTIIGLTPTTHKGALWMNKQLGFRQVSVMPSVVGDMQMVLLTKSEWSDE